MGRRTKTTYRYGNGPEKVLVENTYDEQGRLQVKDLHGKVNRVEYTYNIRGWLTGIRDGEFREELHYGSPTGTQHMSFNDYYGGNIGGSTYTSGGVSSEMTYRYDGLNRLSDARYTIRNVLNPYGVAGYNESFTYDKHGNILTLSRHAGSDFEVGNSGGDRSGRIVG